jgi:tetratricopeptide (TPR) repeat protein
MIEQHLDREALERYLGDLLPDRESRSIQRHLFTCAVCEERLLALLPGPLSSPEQAREYRGLVRRLLQEHGAEIAWRRRGLAAERFAASALWREIEPLDQEQRRTRIRGDSPFQSWGFFELLLDRSFQMVIEDARRAEDLVRLALEVAEQLSGEKYGSGSVEAAKTRAWTYLGNALRVLGDFHQADRAFQTAELYLSRSWLDPLDEALLQEYKALLRRAQRRFAEALELFDGALALYREVNETHLQGRALMAKGLALRYQGDCEGATECFRASLLLLDGLREPRLVGMSRYNLIACLEDAGRTAEAAALIPEARRVMEQVGTRSDRLRLRWLEGRLAAALGQLSEAEEALREARQGFAENSLSFDVALVSLDLATVLLRQRRLDETKRLAAEMLPIFQSREVHREALAALIVLQQAADMEQLTLDLVDEIATYLKQAREDPGLRFR